MKKPLFFSFFLGLVCMLNVSGIYRDDAGIEPYKKLANEPQFDCVGNVRQVNGDAGGSCVLIAGRYVLSAAHVFITSKTKKEKSTIDGKTITSYASGNRSVGDIKNYVFVFKGKTYRGRKLAIHPSYLDDKTKGQCDIAIIELEDEVIDIDPANLFSGKNELNQEVTGVGFGGYGKAGEPETIKSGGKMKIAGQNRVDSIGGFLWNNEPTMMFCDFDKPGDAFTNRLGKADPLPLEYISTGGDSGGGLFMKSENDWTLIGICGGPGGGVEINTLMKTGYYGQGNGLDEGELFY